MKIIRLSFWYGDDGDVDLRPMPSICVANDVKSWFRRENQAGITHRLNVPKEITWRHFFEKDEIISEENVFYKLNEEQLALFILTYY